MGYLQTEPTRAPSPAGNYRQETNPLGRAASRTKSESKQTHPPKK